jgi:hypothetical protein
MKLLCKRHPQGILKKKRKIQTLTLRNARFYNVDEQRLQRRIRGIGSRKTPKPSLRALDPAQERVLMEYIDSLDRIGALPTPEMIHEAALTILGLSHIDGVITPLKLSKMWKYRFLQIHPEYKKGIR